MKIITRILIILILPLLFIGGINYSIDPDYTLNNSYIRPLVSALVDGNMVSGPVNVNSRLLKKQWIENMPEMPEVLVLGSSRTLSISKQLFHSHSFFNASVTNCTFEDMFAFLRIIESKNKGYPNEIIICADQWLFGNSFNEKRWLVNRSETVEMALEIGTVPIEKFPGRWVLDKEFVKELFSVKYLFRSIISGGKSERFEITHTVDSTKMIFLPDGSRSVPEKNINMDETNVLTDAMNYFYSSSDEHFKEIDEFQCVLFEGMIKMLMSRNCKVILFIPPYHPKTYELMKNSNKSVGIFNAEIYLREFAKENDLKLIGSSDPYLENLSSTDFYDAVHLKPEIVNRFLMNEIDSVE